MNKLFNYVDGAFYINLDHREDKKNYMENQFKEMGISEFVKRKRAYSPADLGYEPVSEGRYEHITYSLGNKTTHIELIKFAKENNLIIVSSKIINNIVFYELKHKNK
jgi:hypothetical protein